MQLYTADQCVTPPPSIPPPPPPPTVPSAPLNLKVDFIGRRSINVSWLIPAQPNGVLLFYQLEYSIEGTPPLLTLDVPAGTLTASLPDLTPAQVYLITVRANTSVGFGSRSEPVRATTVTDSESAHGHTSHQHNTAPHYTTQCKYCTVKPV